MLREVTVNRIADADTNTLFTGRDIFAAWNYLRCSTFAAGLAAVTNDMPTRVIERLAAHVGATDPTDYADVVRKARG